MQRQLFRSSVPAFYINLNRDLDRRQLLEKELARAGISAERIAGVNGRAVPNWLRPFYDDRMGPGEVGCSASHLTICRVIVDRGLPFALVLEDDARLAGGFLTFVENAIRMAPPDWDVIRLIETSQPSQVLAQIGGGRRLVRYLKIPRSTTGLIISRSGAEKLLTPRLVKEPIDVEIRWPWQLNLNVYGIDPPPVTQASGVDLETTIAARSRPRKFNQIRRMMFNIEKMGFANYFTCRFGSRSRIARSGKRIVQDISSLARVR